MNNIFNQNNAIKWITANKTSSNIYCFKKIFNLNKKILNADLYICGLGFYQAKINGVIFDKHYFKPNVSDYCKRSDPLLESKTTYFAYYDTYDVTSYLNNGENILDVYVGPGYFHNVDKMDAPNYNYGKTRLIFVFVINYEDETNELIYSDSSTLVALSHSYSRLFKGDYYDFSNISLDYSESVELNSKINLRPSIFNNDIVGKTYLPKCISNEGNIRIYDFGLNHTGGIKCHIKGEKGTVVKIKYAEFMNRDGTLNFLSSSYSDFKEEEFTPPFYTCNAKKYPVYQENTYILSGNEDVIEPLFSYRCYRYIEINCPKEVEIKDLVSLFIHSDVKRISTFNCSNPIFNHIYNCYIQTELCNLHSGLALDCPHREKVAYTGDGQITAEALLYNFDSVNFFNKWLDDIFASQSIDGHVPNAAPDMAVGGGYFWGYAIIRIPLKLYDYTGDKSYLEKALPYMSKWIKYLSLSRGDDGLVTRCNQRWFLGDWLAPKPIMSDVTYINTVCFYLSLKHYIKIHKILSINIDEQLNHLFEKTKSTIINKYFDKEKLVFSKNVQGESLLGFYAGLLDAELQEKARYNLFNEYKNNDYHIDTGIILTPILFETFAKFGEFEKAYLLLTQMDYPSYYYMLQNETTIPEHWSKRWLAYKMNDEGKDILEGTGDTSHCHPMFGSIVPWIQKHVGGINLKNLKNKEIIFSPKYLNKINRCSSSIKDISLYYEVKENKINFDINIPNDYHGTFSLPYTNYKILKVVDSNGNSYNSDSLSIELNSGHYFIEVECELNNIIL